SDHRWMPAGRSTWRSAGVGDVFPPSWPDTSTSTTDTRPGGRSSPLHVEAELHDVAVGHDVVLALDPRLSCSTHSGDRTGLDQVLEGDHLGLDEAALEVGVDHPRGLRRGPALADGPGPGLLGPGREVGLQPERVEADPGELVETCLV